MIHLVPINIYNTYYAISLEKNLKIILENSLEICIEIWIEIRDELNIFIGF